jgi:hypothetical protein
MDAALSLSSVPQIHYPRRLFRFLTLRRFKRLTRPQRRVILWRMHRRAIENVSYMPITQARR